MADLPGTVLSGLSCGNGNGKAYGLQPEHFGSIASGWRFACVVFIVLFHKPQRLWEHTHYFSLLFTFLFSQKTLEKFLGLGRKL